MTSLRGPDPYAIVEQELARQAARRRPDPATLCRVLHEALPTYTWVGLIRHDRQGTTIEQQHGTRRRESPVEGECAAFCGDETIVIHDVATARPFPPWRPEARALISVPVASGLWLVVASEHQGAFGLADRDLLERVARHLAGERVAAQATD